MLKYFYHTLKFTWPFVLIKALVTHQPDSGLMLDDNGMRHTLYVRPTRATFTWPVNNPRIVSHMGWRRIMGKARYHHGLDAVGSDRDVVAPERIYITKVKGVDWRYPAKFVRASYGWRKARAPLGRAWTPYVVGICEYEGREIKYRFLHINPEVKEGDVVLIGEKIGTYGQYGHSFGPHLHFEVYVDGKRVDPHDFIKERLNEKDQKFFL